MNTLQSDILKHFSTTDDPYKTLSGRDYIKIGNKVYIRQAVCCGNYTETPVYDYKTGEWM